MAADVDPVIISRDRSDDGFQPACLSLRDRTSLRGEGKGSHLKIRPDGNPYTPGNALYVDYDRDDTSDPDNDKNDLIIRDVFLDGSRDAFDSIEGTTPYSDVGWGHGHNGVLAYGFNENIGLQNLWIEDFHGYGVHLDASRAARVDNVHVRRCGSRIDPDGTADASRRQGMHIATRSADDDGGTNHSYGAYDAIVSRCTVDGATSNAIDMPGDDQYTRRNKVMHTRVSNCYGGIDLGGQQPKLLHNYALGIETAAFDLGGDGGTMKGCHAISGGSWGHEVSGSNYTLEGNASYTPRGIDIDADGTGQISNHWVIDASNYASIRWAGNYSVDVQNLHLVNSTARGRLDPSTSESIVIDGLHMHQADTIALAGSHSKILGGTHTGAGDRGYNQIEIHGPQATVRDIHFKNVNSRGVYLQNDTNNDFATLRNLTWDGSGDWLIYIDGAVNDARIYGGDADWSNVHVAASSNRTTINDVGVNAGDPSAGNGQWAGNGYEGVTVYDETAADGTAYRYLNGQWSTIA